MAGTPRHKGPGLIVFVIVATVVLSAALLGLLDALLGGSTDSSGTILVPQAPSQPAPVWLLPNEFDGSARQTPNDHQAAWMPDGVLRIWDSQTMRWKVPNLPLCRADLGDHQTGYFTNYGSKRCSDSDLLWVSQNDGATFRWLDVGGPDNTGLGYYESWDYGSTVVYGYTGNPNMGNRGWLPINVADPASSPFFIQGAPWMKAQYKSGNRTQFPYGLDLSPYHWKEQFAAFNRIGDAETRSNLQNPSRDATPACDTAFQPGTCDTY